MSKRVRELELKLALERHYSEQSIPANRRDFLAEGIKETPAAQAYILAAEPTFDVVEIAREIAQTARGELALAAETKLSDADAGAAELERISQMRPADRISAARASGLA